MDKLITGKKCSIQKISEKLYQVVSVIEGQPFVVSSFFNNFEKARKHAYKELGL